MYFATRAGILVLTVATCLTFADERKKTTQFKIEHGVIALPGPIAFKAASDTIDEDASADALFLVLDFLEAKRDITALRIEGHTDDTGKAAANQDLSERRALAVAKWLIAHGADCKRLVPVGFGQTKPVADDATPQGKAANRRIDFAPAAMRGRPIGGQPLDGGGKSAGDPCK